MSDNENHLKKESKEQEKNACKEVLSKQAKAITNKSKKKTTTIAKLKSIATPSSPMPKMVLNDDTNSINKKITDFFQIRKSSRKCKSELEKDKKEQIEKAILNQLEDGLIVKQIENKGRGVFSTREFNKGDFVVEYSGNLISYRDAKKREAEYSKDTQIGCYMYYFEYKSKSYCVDATAESDRLGRLLNHSKVNPNCHTKLFEVNSVPHLIILASRDIKSNEELTYDYGDRSKNSVRAHPWLNS